MSKNWYKNAVVYGVDVKVFKDSDGDGTGDLQGLISKLDYLSSLGVTCLWLMPFYPSPKADNGYDVADYYDVDPELGTLGDFVEFIDKADQLGIRVVIDLVVNHTSIEHPWFKAAKADRNSKYRDYYIWDDDPDENKEKVMLEGFEDSIWEYVEETDSYYLHRYFKEQADLNMPNPEVRNEILRIMNFWLKLGVSGFRIDAAHVITDSEDVEHIDYGNLHRFFSDMRSFMDERFPTGVLLGEASVGPDELEAYFKGENVDNARMHLLFNFIANKYTMLAFARKEGATILEGLKLYKPIELSHWLNFVRHHDELNLDLLNDDETQEVYNAFAPEEDMRVLEGIRRRLPPMLRNNQARIRLMYTILFGLPGTPLISYGEEIGMGDDLSLPGRNSVRTPMQWSKEENGGFSTAPREKLYRPVIDSGDYSYERINVQKQQVDPSSLLNFVSRLINIRRQNAVIGTGEWHTVRANSEKVAAIYYEAPEAALLVVYNLSDDEVTAKLFPEFIPKKLIDIFSDSEYKGETKLDDLKLNGFGYRWIRVLEREDVQFVNK
jgi:maltose alpha-D-glucosyltransferase / alpha-amylase